MHAHSRKEIRIGHRQCRCHGRACREPRDIAPARIEPMRVDHLTGHAGNDRRLAIQTDAL